MRIRIISRMGARVMMAGVLLFGSLAGAEEATARGPSPEPARGAEEATASAPLAEWPLTLTFPSRPPMLLQLRTTLTLWAGTRSRALEVMVDVGYPSELVLSRAAMEELDIQGEEEVKIQVGEEKVSLLTRVGGAPAHTGISILGQAFLQRYCATMDFQRSMLMLNPPRPRGSPPPKFEGTLAMPYHAPTPASGFRGASHILVDAELNGVKGEYHVDTGFQYTWCAVAFAKEADIVNPEGKTEGNASVTSVTLGGSDVSAYLPRVYVRPPTSAHARTKVLFGDLGLTFLRKFVVTVDAVNRVLQLTPWKRPSTSRNSPTLGVELVEGSRYPKGLVIRRVRPGETGERAGLKEGDALLTLDRTPLGYFGILQQELEQFYEVGERVTLGFRRGDALMSASVTLSAR